MKKTLTLIRHAKSSWNTPGTNDHERILNKRGLIDTPHMGAALATRDIHFDIVLCSSARRAIQTLELLRAYPLVDEGSVHYLDELYCASVDTLINIIQQLDDGHNNVAIVAHNPGLEDLANKLIPDRMESMSTCSVVQIGFDLEGWGQLKGDTGASLLDLKPKDL